MLIALELKLPPPPSWLIDQIDHCVRHRDLELIPSNKISMANGYSGRIIYKDSVAHISRFQKRFMLGEQAKTWIADVTDLQASIPTVAINEGSGPFHGPHVDSGRTYALTYMIETGGDDVKTSWWHKSDNPVIIDDTDQNARFTCDYDDDLALLHQITMRPKKWYLYNTRILHSVEGCLGTRISLQMNVTNPWALLKFVEVDQ